jgi:hypothetical protein
MIVRGATLHSWPPPFHHSSFTSQHGQSRRHQVPALTSNIVLSILLTVASIHSARLSHTQPQFPHTSITFQLTSQRPRIHHPSHTPPHLTKLQRENVHRNPHPPPPLPPHTLLPLGLLLHPHPARPPPLYRTTMSTLQVTLCGGEGVC